VTPDLRPMKPGSIVGSRHRNLRYPLFEVFDRPDAGASCARRDHTTTANQFLLVLNSQFSLDCANAMQQRFFRNAHLPRTSNDLEKADSSNGATISQLYIASYGRLPTRNELNRAETFLNSWPDSPSSAQTARCLAILNSSEFIFVD
jgi:hypothetical protein